MIVGEAALAADISSAPGTIVNDFSIRVATPNGSGSQTSNNAILRALFRMGIPVSGKNLFPSNIQGEPTWYTIRCSKDGYLARREHTEVLVAMNAHTALDDVAKLPPGSVCYYPEKMRLKPERDDVTFYAMAVKEIVSAADPPRRFRDYLANMVYVGVLAEMLGIEFEALDAALMFHFKDRRKPVDLNMDVIRRAANWAREHLTKADPYRVERMDANTGKLLIDGNSAGALGSVYGGVSVLSWYPITPSSSLAEATIGYLGQLRRDPETGENSYVVVQAEDELAAVGMVVGAGWMGARAMTATSGPGISLMAEFVGYAYYAEIPLVIWDIQRTGPSTGLPTRVSQGDLMFVHLLGHGDTRHVCLLPATVEECFEFGWRAFDLAERLQTPVFVLSDLDLGMNQWVGEPFTYPDVAMDRGKVLTAEDVSQNGFARYKDIDGDGIPYRTLPGTNHPLAAYFTRGSGHDEHARYSEDAAVYARNMSRLRDKWEHSRQYVPPPVIDQTQQTGIGIIGFGSTDPAIVEARDSLSVETIATNYLRLRALPFTAATREFIAAHERLYVVDLNTGGQLHQLLTLEYPEFATRFISLAHNDGLPLTAHWVTEQIVVREEK